MGHEEIRQQIAQRNFIVQTLFGKTADFKFKRPTPPYSIFQQQYQLQIDAVKSKLSANYPDKYVTAVYGANVDFDKSELEVLSLFTLYARQLWDVQSETQLSGLGQLAGLMDEHSKIGNLNFSNRVKMDESLTQPEFRSGSVYCPPTIADLYFFVLDINRLASFLQGIQISGNDPDHPERNSVYGQNITYLNKAVTRLQMRQQNST